MVEEKKDTPVVVNQKFIKIVEEIKKRTAMPAYKLRIQRDSHPDLLSSKLGGVPYWDLEKAYPVDRQGQKMMMIAQINFTEANLKDERLPNQGMLQFFISQDESSVYGMDFDEPDVQSNFRVVYHEIIDDKVTKEQIQAMNLPICTSEENEEYSPIFREAELAIEEIVDYKGPSAADFYGLLKEVVKVICDEEITEASIFDYLEEEEYNYLTEQIETEGHKILGYPFFTQYDPRKETDYYDTLLLQIDSEMADDGDYVLWGDCGVANFFINSEALVRKDFSKVLYNWDCC